MIQMADVGIGISGQEGMQVLAETRVGQNSGFKNSLPCNGGEFD